MATAEDLKQLLLYHSYDQRLLAVHQSVREIEKKAKNTAIGRGESAKKIASMEGQLQEQNEAWKASERALKSAISRASTLREKVDSSGKMLQWSLLSKQLEDTLSKIKGEEESQLRIIEEMETIGRDIDQERELLAAMDGESLAKQMREQLDTARGNLADIGEKMQGIQSHIPVKFFENYLRLRHSIAHPPFMVGLRDGFICGGCRMRLPTELNPAASIENDELIACDFCHRILYCNGSEE
ncbi:MAG: hypothetical protein LBI69_01290 [Puniceicoccales bacterium]|jgi:predicted  nucleic acid-binding Zn-ribbon protein|nr:hypothetical protein [Puniceicoccales bacterium]